MNRATKNIVATMGIMLGIAGIDHGFFETLQGNQPTDGLIIQAIGDAQQLTWWQKILPENTRRVLGKLWPGSLIVGCILFLIALEIAIFGFVPGINDPDQKLYICWSLLFGALGLFLFTFVAGFAHDIQARILEGVNL